MDLDAFADIERRLPWGTMTIASSAGTHWILHGLVRLMRPDRVVELGTHRGDASAYLVRGLVENGRGMFLGYEADPELRAESEAKLLAAFPDGGPWEMHESFDITPGAPKLKTDFAFIDVSRKGEYLACFRNLVVRPGGIVCAHDSHRSPAEILPLRNAMIESGYQWIDFPPERGLLVGLAPGTK